MSIRNNRSDFWKTSVRTPTMGFRRKTQFWYSVVGNDVRDQDYIPYLKEFSK